CSRGAPLGTAATAARAAIARLSGVSERDLALPSPVQFRQHVLVPLPPLLDCGDLLGQVFDARAVLPAFGGVALIEALKRIDERRVGGWTLPTILQSRSDFLRSCPDQAWGAESASEHKHCRGKPAVKRHHGGPPYAAFSGHSGEELIPPRRVSCSKSF